MASIVVQQQDLFFEFDFGLSDQELEKHQTLSNCKGEVFLIGCFRNDQKHQLDWIRDNAGTDGVGKYNGCTIKYHGNSNKRNTAFYIW